MQKLQSRRMPVLDLRDLSYADPQGLELLRSLGQQGFQMTRLSPFLTELLEARPSD